MNRIRETCLVLFALLVLGMLYLPAQEKPQERVTVTAAEIPVRVLLDGRAVKGLTQADFELYENGVRQEISAFQVIERHIADSAPGEVSAEGQNSEPRLFILIFNIFDYTDVIGEAIDHFFQNFFGPGCRLIVVVEDRILNIERGKGLDDTVTFLKETLKKAKHISTLNTYRAFDKLNLEAERLLSQLRAPASPATTNPFRDVLTFYESYLNAWLEYRRQYLSPNLSLYENIANKARQLEGEKWAICFQQRELFPRLKHHSAIEREVGRYTDSQVDSMGQMNARIIRSKQTELQRTLDISNNFPAERMQSIFMEADITFHLLLLRSFRNVSNRNFEMREVAQDYEVALENISYSTGGFTSFSNKIAEALEQAAQKVDYHYVLVYNPRDGLTDKKRKIQVKVNKAGSEVIHLKQISRTRSASICIAGFEFRRKQLKFILKDYEQVRMQNKTAGLAEVKITLYDNDARTVFEEKKNLELIKKETSISLNFDWLKPGSHFIIIQVIDKLTQQTDVYSGTIEL